MKLADLDRVNALRERLLKAEALNHAIAMADPSQKEKRRVTLTIMEPNATGRGEMQIASIALDHYAQAVCNFAESLLRGELAELGVQLDEPSMRVAGGAGDA